jgi:pyruvate dehydrogenase E2 component (dihydrolipoamide acetyltransferase)
MAESKRTVPHFYLQTSASAEAMAARRTASPGRPLLWDAFFIHAAGKALREFDRLACRFEDDHLIDDGLDAIGLAVDVDGDLFPLAIEHPAAKTTEQISIEIEEAVARLRSGDPQARMIRRASLTVSNLGGSNIESCCAVINPPEAAILAVGKVMPVPTVVEEQIVVQKRVNLTLSVDHRVASGKYAAGFLTAIVEHLESC